MASGNASTAKQCASETRRGGDIEIHLQGLSFNAIECDEIGSASVSFVPIKPGNYPLYVGNVPLSVGRPMGESGVQTQGKYVISEIKVR